VLVTEDAMGMFTDFTPKFVKRYAEMAEEMGNAAAEYAREVKARTFPSIEHCYGKK
jgi:3-methyl-2-oxobutanoate hydroxymethyltransferase